MPPKKPKKTKEELEAERLAEEAEAAKQAAIAAKKAAEEESKRKIEEAKLAEERRVTRAAEVSRLEEEYAKYLELLKDKQAQRQAESALQVCADETHTLAKFFFPYPARFCFYFYTPLQKSRFEWEKFRDPTDQPDASSERDMNTFLSIMLETKCESMTEMLGIVKNIEGIASAAEDSWFESFARKDVEAQARLHAYLGEFNSLVLEKIDQATASFLHSIKNHLNAKLELEVEELARGVSIGMWGSLQEGSTTRPARKSVQLEKMGLQFDIPKQVLQQNPFVHRVVKIPFDMFSGGAYAPIPTTNKLVLSDLLYIDILIPPALPYLLRAKKWLIQDSSEGEHGLRKVSYPSSVPCKFYIKVPEDLIMSDDVKVALWNSDSKEWAEDAVTDFQYSESTRLVQFLMSTVGMLAFVRNRNADFPYKRWSLGPARNSNDAVSEQRARFTLNTQRFEVVIDIVGSSCCLAKSFNKSVNSLVGVKMPPGVLLGKLQKRGVCIMPVDADLAAINSTLPEPLQVKVCPFKLFLHPCIFASRHLN